jgi:thiamine-monophosphate kinase
LPDPPVPFGAALRDLASSSVDVSDGLVADLGHVAEASGVRIAIEAERVPRSEALRAFWGDSIEAILRAATAGDDYQIAFTADPLLEDQIRVAAKEVAITRIGTVMAGQGMDVTYQGQSIPVPKPGYRHL